MKTKMKISSQTLHGLAIKVAEQIEAKFPTHTAIKLWGVPRGGIPAAYLVASALHARRKLDVYLTETANEAHVIIDDIVDSGATKKRLIEQHPDKMFIALIEDASHWIEFPWERTLEGVDASADDVVLRLLQYIGEDVTRPGLVETPQRVMKAWRDWTEGYHIDPKELLKTFEDGAEGVDEMVTVHDIPVWSHCEHHLAPFFGTASVAYVPNKKIIGLSKLVRVVNAFSRRLQVQERLTNQIADLLMTGLEPMGVGVSLKCRHMCMESRGVKAPNCFTTTTALRGVFKDEQETRAEFLRLTGGR